MGDPRAKQVEIVSAEPPILSIPHYDVDARRAHVTLGKGSATDPGACKNSAAVLRRRMIEETLRQSGIEETAPGGARNHR